MSSAISSSRDTMKGCGLLHAFKRLLRVRYIRTISAGRGSHKRRRQSVHVSTLPRKQPTVQPSSFQNHKSSPGLVRGPFVEHHKLYVAAVPNSLCSSTDLKHGMNMMETEKNDANQGEKINKHHVYKGQNSLVRATSGNVMIYGHLGNLGGLRGQNVCSVNVVDFLPRTANEARVLPNANILDNEYSKKARYNKTLGSNSSTARATLIDSENISLKIAALVTSGQILDAVHECRRILKIDPRCKETNHLLASLYFRLGEAEKATYHYKLAKLDADSKELEKARALQENLQKCTVAKQMRDWRSIIKETDSAMRSGATSSPQILSLQAEAYLKLRKHENADIALSKATQFDADACKKFYGPVGSANLLRVEAQVDMTAGRFDDALEAARKAEQLDPKSREINAVVQKAFATSQARSKGNGLFRQSKFQEAYEAYDEGLYHDPHNSVLLSNRAACLFKLGQYERAAKDCTAALSLRPSYSKARLRRADCNAKMGKWEAAIRDYNVLLQKSPEDEELTKSMSRAQVQLSKQRIREATRQNLSQI